VELPPAHLRFPASCLLKETFMRMCLSTIAAAIALAACCGATPSTAAEARYCLQGKDWGYPGNCEFMSYQQCRATASGTMNYCGINPAFAFRHPNYDYSRDYY
jgi:hypothetical protein